LCWANENWTRRWDGLEKEMLLEQRYSPEDDLVHIRSLIPMFPDHRYIKVMDRPIFLVYKASEMPEPVQTLDRWRTEAKRAGLKGLFLVRVESYTDLTGDPRTMGFNAALEFQPRAGLLWKRIFRRKWWHILLRSSLAPFPCTIRCWNLLRGKTAYRTGRRGCPP